MVFLCHLRTRGLASGLCVRQILQQTMARLIGNQFLSKQIFLFGQWVHPILQPGTSPSPRGFV